MFRDKELFEEIYHERDLQPLCPQNKEDECDYDTDPEDVEKCAKFLQNDLAESIQFFVEEQPLDLVANLLKGPIKHKKW